MPEVPGRLRRVDPTQYHVTVKFLGDVDRTRVDAVSEALAGAVTGHEPPSFRVLGVAVFARRSGGGVVVAEIEPDDGWRRLHRDVEGALEPLGFVREERPFRPHVTLARVRGGRLRPPSSPETKPIAVGDVDEVALVQSLLGPGGPEYRVLRGYSLQSG